MTGSRHNTPSRCPLSTFEARVQWAIKRREVYKYDDTVELKVDVPEIASDDDEDEIQSRQRKYERRYRSKKEEKIREEETEKERMVRELLKKFPDIRLETTEGNSNPGPPQLKRKREIDTPVRPMKIVRPVPAEKPTVGNKYDVPCERCTQRGITCHEQNPVKTRCFECRKGKTGCSFVSRANLKGIPHEPNRKKSPLPSNSSEEDSDYAGPAGFRRSVRNLGSTYFSTDISKLVTVLESINTTIRDGFDNLQRALEKHDDNSHLNPVANNVTNHDNRPGSSPVY